MGYRQKPIQEIKFPGFYADYTVKDDKSAALRHSRRAVITYGKAKGMASAKHIEKHRPSMPRPPTRRKKDTEFTARRGVGWWDRIDIIVE